MYTNTKIDTENAKTIRAPLDTEFWIAPSYYSIVSEATAIKPVYNSSQDYYRPFYGLPVTDIPMDLCYPQERYFVSGTKSIKNIINGNDLQTIAWNRGWKIYTSNNDFRDDFLRYQANFLHPPYSEVQGEYKKQELTHSYYMGINSDVRKKHLTLIMRDWTDTTEITIKVGSYYEETFLGKELYNNNIAVDLSFLPDNSTMATAKLTIVDEVPYDSDRTNDKAWFKVGAFTIEYIYYINSKSLLSADAALRGDLRVNASTVPTSQINVNCYTSEDMFKRFQASYARDVYFYYVAGYLDDIDLSHISDNQTSSMINPNFPVMSRRFEINEPLKFTYPNQMSIEAEDLTCNLYNTDMDSLTFHNGVVTMFTDDDPFVRSTSDPDYGQPSFTRIYQNIDKLNNELDTMSGYGGYSDNEHMTRYKFIFWLMIYAYAKGMYKNKPDFAKKLINVIWLQYRDFFTGSNNYAEYRSSGTMYQEGYATEWYDTESNTSDFHYLSFIDSKAPLPLIAWIQDTWHGKASIKNESGVINNNLPFYPKFVDSGRPAFSYDDYSPVIEINESDMADFTKDVEVPIRVLKVPKNHKIAYHTNYVVTNTRTQGSYQERLEKTTEQYMEFKVEEVGNLDVYNYQGGFHFRNLGIYTSPDYDDDHPQEKAYHGISNGLKHKILGPLYFGDNVYVGRTYQVYGAQLAEKQGITTLTNTDLDDGETVRISYDNYMGRIIDDALVRQSVLGRSNETGKFTWRGDVRLQPRDIFTLNKLDGTSVDCTVESIETKHEGGGTTQTITYREGII